MRKLYSYKDLKILLKYKKEKDYLFAADYIINFIAKDLKRRFKIIILEGGDAVDSMEVLDGYSGGLLRLEISMLEYIDGYFIMHTRNEECKVIFNGSILNKSYLQYFLDLSNEKI